MLLAYVDESHNKSIYWLVGLVCPEHTITSLTNALDTVARKAAEAYVGVRERAELHGHDVFHGKGDWSALEKMPRARIGVYNAAFGAIADHDVDILLRGVNTERLRHRYGCSRHPHDVTLEHLLERLDENAALSSTRCTSYRPTRAASFRPQTSSSFSSAAGTPTSTPTHVCHTRERTAVAAHPASDRPRALLATVDARRPRRSGA